MNQKLMTRIAAALAVLAAGSAFAQGTAADGEKVFATQKCATCHSVGAQGNKKGPLDNTGAKLTADEIRMWIIQAPEMTAKTKAGRKPAMKSYSALSKADVDALVAYLQTLKKG